MDIIIGFIVLLVVNLGYKINLNFCGIPNFCNEEKKPKDNGVMQY